MNNHTNEDLQQVRDYYEKADCIHTITSILFLGTGATAFYESRYGITLASIAGFGISTYMFIDLKNNLKTRTRNIKRLGK
jgi:hypothetical protein